MIETESKKEHDYFATVSDRGKLHIECNMPNQDNALFCYGENISTISISDGVGSCKYSDIGSREATEACLRVMKLLNNKMLLFAEEVIVEKIIQTWKSYLPFISYDYCATLKAAFISKDGIILVSIGDGILAAKVNDTIYLAPNKNNDFVNETQCLNPEVQSKDFWTYYIDIRECRPNRTIFMCTDGVENAIYENRKTEFVDEIARICTNEMLPSLRAFLGEICKYCFDDKTIGVYRYE